MVFRARGCRTCVQRRIKCDIRHPICGRCEKAGRICQWNPNEQAGLHFISENAYAQGRPRRPRGSKDASAEALEVIRTATSSLPSSLSISLDDHAFHYWAQTYIPDADELHEAAHEWNSHVINHWMRAEPGSCLHLAVSTLSRAVFGKARGVPIALKEADRSYAQCLVRTQQAVSGQPNENMDDLLLTTMLMGYFENIRFNVVTSESNGHQTDAVGSRFTNVFCHYEGAMGLLKVRRERCDGSDTELDKVVRRQIVSPVCLNSNASIQVD